MPNYDYECSIHGTVEVFLKISQLKEIQTCPNCKEEMVRVVSAPSLHGIYSNPKKEEFDNHTKNELDSALKEHDGYRKQEENNTERDIKNGDFIGSVSDL